MAQDGGARVSRDVTASSVRKKPVFSVVCKYGFCLPCRGGDASAITAQREKGGE